MSTTDIKIGNIIDMLSLQSSRNVDLSEESVDHQFMILIKIAEKNLLEQEYELFFDWLNELIRKETELKKKRQVDYHIFNKTPLNVLINKIYKSYKKIFDLLIEDIEISTQDYFNMNGSNLEFAQKVKIDALSRINTYLIYLTNNRSVNENLYDYYIDLFTQAKDIFD